MPKTRPPYPLEFWEDAVALVRASGRPVKEIAADLRVSEQTLSNRVSAARADGSEPAMTLDEKEELSAAAAGEGARPGAGDPEKAAAWFAKESGSTP